MLNNFFIFASIGKKRRVSYWKEVFTSILFILLDEYLFFVENFGDICSSIINPYHYNKHNLEA